MPFQWLTPVMQTQCISALIHEMLSTFITYSLAEAVMHPHERAHRSASLGLPLEQKQRRPVG